MSGQTGTHSQDSGKRNGFSRGSRRAAGSGQPAKHAFREERLDPHIFVGQIGNTGTDQDEAKAIRTAYDAENHVQNDGDILFYFVSTCKLDVTGGSYAVVYNALALHSRDQIDTPHVFKGWHVSHGSNHGLSSELLDLIGVCESLKQANKEVRKAVNKKALLPDSTGGLGPRSLTTHGKPIQVVVATPSNFALEVLRGNIGISGLHPAFRDALGLCIQASQDLQTLPAGFDVDLQVRWVPESSRFALCAACVAARIRETKEDCNIRYHTDQPAKLSVVTEFECSLMVSNTRGHSSEILDTGEDQAAIPFHPPTANENTTTELPQDLASLLPSAHESNTVEIFLDQNLATRPDIDTAISQAGESRAEYEEHAAGSDKAATAAVKHITAPLKQGRRRLCPAIYAVALLVVVGCCCFCFAPVIASRSALGALQQLLSALQQLLSALQRLLGVLQQLARSVGGAAWAFASQSAMDAFRELSQSVSDTTRAFFERV